MIVRTFLEAVYFYRQYTSITALHNDAPLMLAADRDILASPIPANNLRNPTRLELWAKRTCTTVNRSKADATTVVHRTHERLTHYFRYRRKKKTATPTQPSTHPISSTTAHQPHETDLERAGDRSNTTHQLHTTFQFVLKGAVCFIPHKGGRNLGAFIFKIGFSVFFNFMTVVHG